MYGKIGICDFSRRLEKMYDFNNNDGYLNMVFATSAPHNKGFQLDGDGMVETCRYWGCFGWCIAQNLVEEREYGSWHTRVGQLNYRFRLSDGKQNVQEVMEVVEARSYV